MLLTKLFPPSNSPATLPRPQLIKRLNDGLSRDLTLVAAPAGYGKTSLVVQWLTQLDQQASWLSLDAADNDPFRFWEHVVAALQQLDPAIGARAQQAMHVSRPAQLHEIILSLINDIWLGYQINKSQVVLILDDYHFIEEPLIHQSVDFLLEQLPSTALHLILTTRADPPLNLARRRARRQLSEIRAADLRFSADEITNLYRLLGIPLAAESVQQLAAKSEGWITSLHLAAMSLSNDDNPQQFVAEMAGTDRFIGDYLISEVLNHQPAAVREFLLLTAGLDQLSLPLCQHILKEVAPHIDARPIIAALDQSNLFLIYLDRQNHWFRYHHLFADLLLQQQKAVYGNQIETQIFELASHWFATQNEWDTAIDLAIRSGNHRLLAQSILAFNQEEGSWLNLRREWFDYLPESAYEAEPLLYILKGLAIFLTPNKNRFAEIPILLDQATLAADQMEERPTTLYGHLAYTRIMVGLLERRPDLTQQTQQAIEVFESLPADAFYVRGQLAYWIAKHYQTFGVIEEMEAWLDQAIALNRRSGDIYLYTMSHAMRWMSNIQQGNFTTSRKDITTFIQQEPSVHNQHPVSGTAYISLGAALMEMGDLELAANALETGLELIRLTSEYGIEFTARWDLGFIWYVQGQEAEAIAMAETIGERIPAFEEFGLLLKGWLLSSQNKTTQAQQLFLDQWYTNHEALLEEPLPTNLGGGRYLTLLKQFLLIRIKMNRYRHQDLPADQLTQALSRLDGLHRAFNKPMWWRWQAQILMHELLIMDTLGNREEAIDKLVHLLNFTQPTQFRLIFLEAHELMRELLPLAMQRGADPSFASDLLRRIDDLRPNKMVIQQPLIDPLSERELEVLALIKEGMTNKEIAAELFLSPNTVRVHTSNIYGKLSVTTRTQAAQKGQALGLI